MRQHLCWDSCCGTATLGCPSKAARLPFPSRPSESHYSALPPLQDSSDAREPVERCRALAQKWREEYCSPSLPSRQRAKVKITFRNRLHAPRPTAVDRIATCSFIAANFQLSDNRRWHRDCSLRLEPCAHLCASSRGSPTVSVTNSERINRVSSNRHFAVANY